MPWADLHEYHKFIFFGLPFWGGRKVGSSTYLCLGQIYMNIISLFFLFFLGLPFWGGRKVGSSTYLCLGQIYMNIISFFFWPTFLGG